MKFFTIIIISVLGLLILTASCATEGCTDPHANNFSYEATKDDGSCDYGGCMDENALNFDPDAVTDNGTCRYNGGVHIITTKSRLLQNGETMAVEINGAFIGKLGQRCTALFPDCQTACAHLKFTDQPEGFYVLNYWIIKRTSSTTYDTLVTSGNYSLKITGGDCNVYTIE
jgi:hypothetical protein